MTTGQPDPALTDDLAGERDDDQNAGFGASDGDPRAYRSVDDVRDPLFHGDSGWLTLAARRATVLLLKETHLIASRYPEEWDALLDEREAVAALLNNLFLVLEIDQTHNVAYKVQAANDGGGAFNTLLRQNPYQVPEVKILLFLRERLRESAAQGHDEARARGEELLDLLATDYPDHKGDHAAARQRDKTWVRRLVNDDILLAEHGSRNTDVEDATYVISPIVEALLTPDRLNAFAQALREDLGNLTAGDDATVASHATGVEITDGTDAADDASEGSGERGAGARELVGGERTLPLESADAQDMDVMASDGRDADEDPGMDEGMDDDEEAQA